MCCRPHATLNPALYWAVGYGGHYYGCALFVTSQYDVILTSFNKQFGEVRWHNMHIILHALSLLVVKQCVTTLHINYQRSKLDDRSKTQHSTLRQSSAQLLKYQVARFKTVE